MKKQYLKTERANFMCPNMHYGILFTLDIKYDKCAVETSLDRLAQAHPFLRSVIAYEEGTEQIYYKIGETSRISLYVKDDKNNIWEDYRSISLNGWNVMKEGMLKVFIYPDSSDMIVLFVVNHLLTDGRGAAGLAAEFTNDYSGGCKPAHVVEHLIENINDLPPKSRLPFASRLLIKSANNTWKKEKHSVDYSLYLAFEQEYVRNHKVEYKTYELDTDRVADMNRICKQNGFTMNDFLLAHMFVLSGSKKVIMAADIRRLLSCYKKGALGNYATAMSIVSNSKATDVIERAKQVHKLVQKSMHKNRRLMLILACFLELDPTLLDAATISALGGFKSKAGHFVGATMFNFDRPSSYSITNLGKFEHDHMKSLMFIPPASPAAKLTLGVVTLNGVMYACSSENI